jgi:hypothetical protein
MDAGHNPYLSVVVATRNDDHGGDPLRRLQSLVNSFDSQCRRSGLDAELIVVEWNPPEGRPRVRERLVLSDRPACSCRFIEVPPELHARLRHADVLPLFQMIAKNAGIRRARGQFVLATNIDVVLSSELVEYLARRPLRSRCLYRVDRHDVEAAFPVDAALDEQMAYCATRQLRVHTRWGTRPVDPAGRETVHAADIVDGDSVSLGGGWHVREDSADGPFRWASESASLVVRPQAAIGGGDSDLVLDLESTPYDTGAWADVSIRLDGEPGNVAASVRVHGRTALRIPLAASDSPIQLQLCTAATSADARSMLPLFEQRSSLCYRVYSARLDRRQPQPSIGNEGQRSGRSWFDRTKEAMADALATQVARLAGNGLRNRIARTSADFREIDEALRHARQEIRTLAPLTSLAPLHAFLRDQRPANLHVNACGDFQLMSREHWDELRGYPELETFSMNLDGLLSFMADAAGIREQVLQMPIYHLEHEVGSGWSPEGEAQLRRRIDERGISWVDASTVYIWGAYMRWLGRPVLFNGAGWGMSGASLPEYPIGLLASSSRPPAGART